MVSRKLAAMTSISARRRGRTASSPRATISPTLAPMDEYALQFPDALFGQSCPTAFECRRKLTMTGADVGVQTELVSALRRSRFQFPYRQTEQRSQVAEVFVVERGLFTSFYF